MIALIRREPALFAALINAIIACAIVFGLNLTEAQVAAIVVVANAILAIVVRSAVTPVGKPKPRPKPRV